jgi:hypothetical protein
MPTLDLRFPPEIRGVLAELGRMLSDVAPASVLTRTEAPEDEDPEFAEHWLAGLHERIEEDLTAVVRLLDMPDFGVAPVKIPEDEALSALRGFTVLRLTLRETALREITDEAMEAGKVDRRKLTAPRRHAYACYGALGEIQAAICEML